MYLYVMLMFYAFMIVYAFLCPNRTLGAFGATQWKSSYSEGGDLFKSTGSILQSRQPEASESIAAELKAEAGNIRLQDEMRMAEYGGHMQHIVMICDLRRMEGMTELACCSQVQMELAAFREDLSES